MKKLDLFVKTTDDVVHRKSKVGGTLSILVIILAIYLIGFEINSFIEFEYSTQVGISQYSQDKSRILLLMDVDFLNLNCTEFGFDLVDETGNTHLSITDPEKTQTSDSDFFFSSLQKYDLSQTNGGKKGCKIKGKLRLHKTENELHMFGSQKSYLYKDEISQSNSDSLPQDLRSNTIEHGHHWTLEELLEFNSSHKINQFKFEFENSQSSNILPDFIQIQKDPLESFLIQSQDEESLYKYNYHLKIVNFQWIPLNSNPISSFQYTFSLDNEKINKNEITKQPGLFIRMEFSPYEVKYVQVDKKLGRLFVNLSAVIGGMFVVVGVFNRGLLALQKHVLSLNNQRGRRIVKL